MTEEEKMKAMRLARAIASDISLYNEQKIIKGIEQDNLFEVLKDEIEEGRELYKTRVLVLEWLDPPYVAGHWVPELVSLAGGHDVGGIAGERSRARPWSELVTLAPDLVVVALCGFDVERARSELSQRC